MFKKIAFVICIVFMCSISAFSQYRDFQSGNYPGGSGDGYCNGGYDPQGGGNSYPGGGGSFFPPDGSNAHHGGHGDGHHGGDGDGHHGGGGVPEPATIALILGGIGAAAAAKKLKDK